MGVGFNGSSPTDCAKTSELAAHQIVQAGEHITSYSPGCDVRVTCRHIHEPGNVLGTVAGSPPVG